MELNRQIAQISIFIGTIVCVSAWQCKTLNCLIYPLSLKLWKHHIEVSTRTLRIKAGSSFSITCDGSCVGSTADPHLRWYGPDRHWIAYEGSANRVHVEQSFSRRFLKLHIRTAAIGDQGEYTCRGWLGSERGWDTKSVRIIVDQTDVPHPHLPETTLGQTSTTPPSARPTSAPVTTTSTAPPSARPTSAPVTTTSIAPPSARPTSAAVTTTLETLSTTEQTCPHKCGTGECLDMQQVCNSVPDCEDASDESNCVSTVCIENTIACTDGNGCVPTNQICDGIPQCKDESDEDQDVCNSK